MTDAALDTQGTDTQNTQQTDTSWRQSLGEYADKFPEFKTPADLAKGYDGLVRKLGQNPLVKPGDSASEDEKNAYRSRLLREIGVPEKLEEYTFDESKLPEDVRQHADKQLIDQFRQKAFELGVPPSAFNELVAMQVQREVEAFGKQAAQAKESLDKGMAELKTKWGSEYDTKVKSAIDVAKKFYPDLTNAESEVGAKYGNDPVIIQVLADMAAKMGETRLPPSNSASGAGATHDDAKALLQKSFDQSLPQAERDAARAAAQKIYQQLFSKK